MGTTYFLGLSLQSVATAISGWWVQCQAPVDSFSSSKVQSFRWRTGGSVKGLQIRGSLHLCSTGDYMFICSG